MSDLSITLRLRQARRSLTRRRLIAETAGALGLLGAIWLLLAGLDQILVLSERVSLTLTLFSLILISATLFYRLFRLALRPPKLTSLAKSIEATHPHWQDSLICAVEEEQRPAASRTSVSEALIAKVQRDTRQLDFGRLLQRPWQHPACLGGLAALAVLLALSGQGTPVAEKSRAQWQDWRDGQATGLTVHPGNRDVPIGSDQNIEVAIHRGPTEATIEYRSARTSRRFTYPLHRNREDQLFFTFYDLQQPVDYRIVTPTLRSAWYRLETFTPPRLERIEVTIDPPLYLGAEAEVFSELRDLRAPEGARLRMNLTLQAGAGVDLVIDREGEAPEVQESASTDPAGQVTLEWEAGENLRWKLRLRDAEGRVLPTRFYDLRVTPDLPPVIEVTRPGEDREVRPDQEIDFVAVASDDYGLTSINLNFSVSGHLQERLNLYRDDFPTQEELENGLEILPILSRDQTVRITLTPEVLEAQDGDVITYFFTAVDNRRPEPQVTRSEIFFLEVREEIEPEEAEGMDLDEEDLVDVRALIVEMKRLIRLSWRASEMEGSRRAEAQDELSRSMEAIRLETSLIRQRVVEQSGIEEGVLIIDLLNAAVHHMGSAGQFLDQDLIAESLPDQEQALVHLVKLETELLKDQMFSESEDGEGQDGAPPPPSEGDEPEREDDGEAARRLQELLQRTERLADDQAAQNTRTGRLADRSPGAEERNELRQRQDNLTGEARSISRALGEIAGTDEAQSLLRSAGSSMESAARNIGNEQLRPAEREGERARAALLGAIDALESMLQEAAGAQVQELADRARALAEEQSGIGESSGAMGQQSSPDPAEADALREQQEGLRESFQDLLRDLESLAQGLQESFPDAAGELGRTGQNMREANVEGNMGRAGNALLFEQFGRAEELSEEIAQALQEYAEALSETAAGLPQISPERLQRALQQVQEGQRELGELFGEDPGEAGEQGAQISRRIGQSLSRLAESSGDLTLIDIAEALLRESEEAANLFRTDDLLRAAARELERQIIALEIERRARLGRMAAPPPDRYRDLVEEYFRSLSESQN